MIPETLLRKNPNLYTLLPILYVVWSDSLLTPSEITVLHEMIGKQDWLTGEERAALIARINPASEPTADELKATFAIIRDILAAQNGKSEGLVDIGFRLARAYQSEERLLERSRKSLDEFESRLGLIGHEARYHFYPEQRKTITQEQETKVTFDTAVMNKVLDGEQAAIINKVKKLLSDPAFAFHEGETLAGYREKVLAWSRILAAQGLGAMAYPKSCGGRDDMAGYFSVMETLSYHDLSLVVKFGVQFGLFGMSVFFLGTEKHHNKYLKDIGTLALPGCFAMTETSHGSNVRGIETTATYQHASRTFLINTPHPLAQKEYIGNAALHGRMGTVFAKLLIDNKDYGVNAFLVPLRDENGKTLPGIAIGDCGKKMGLNGVDNGTIRFSNVSIPVDNMLDRFAQVTANGVFESPIASDNRRFFTMLGTLVGGRIGIPRAGISATKSGLTIAIRYGDQRRQFGPEGAAEVPILNYRTHQRRLIPLLSTTYALHFSLQYLTSRFMARTEDDMQEIEALAAGLKSFATWHTTETLQECRESCGGKGYLSENRIDDLKNDTDIFTTFEGDNTVLMQLVAKSRLTEFKKEFANMGMMGILNYVAEQAKTSITEKNPITIRSTDDDHLLSSEFHLNAFRYRERAILSSAARRLKRHIDEGMDSFDAFNVVQHHLVQVGFAYIERIILEKFTEAVENTADSNCQQMLRSLCQLFALNQIDRNKGWYLENGYMEGVKTKAIRKLVNQLCWDIRQQAVPLTDAFGIPESLLPEIVRR